MRLISLLEIFNSIYDWKVRRYADGTITIQQTCIEISNGYWQVPIIHPKPEKILSNKSLQELGFKEIDFEKGSVVRI